MSRLLLLLVLLQSGVAHAHSMNSAQWRLTQLDAQTWDSRLRLPEDFEGQLLSLQPQLPATCEHHDEPVQQPADEGVVLRWTLHCPQGAGRWRCTPWLQYPAAGRGAAGRAAAWRFPICRAVCHPVALGAD